MSSANSTALLAVSEPSVPTAISICPPCRSPGAVIGWRRATRGAYEPATVGATSGGRRLRGRDRRGGHRPRRQLVRLRGVRRLHRHLPGLRHRGEQAPVPHPQAAGRQGLRERLVVATREEETIVSISGGEPRAAGE